LRTTHDPVHVNWRARQNPSSEMKPSDGANELK
jgi:hypothetical protein